jgi:UDP-3-O-[3-hydroxymyristoyl] glucosamine N-acyltransferase
MNNQCKLIVISYDTTWCKDLRTFIGEENIDRVDPNDFLVNYDPGASYLNLVQKDMHERNAICNLMDQRNLERFSYIHPTATVYGQIGSGCFIYPQTVICPDVVVDKDVLIHASSFLGNSVKIGRGTTMSASISIGGSTVLGEYCRLGIGVTIYDKIKICDWVYVGGGTVVRKNIEEPGTYTNISHLTKIEK